MLLTNVRQEGEETIMTLFLFAAAATCTPFYSSLFDYEYCNRTQAESFFDLGGRTQGFIISRHLPIGIVRPIIHDVLIMTHSSYIHSATPLRLFS